MNTLAEMCIAFTSTSPSRTPDRCTAAATSAVMFTNARRSGTFMLRYSVWLFMRRNVACGALLPNPAGCLPGLAARPRPAAPLARPARRVPAGRAAQARVPVRLSLLVHRQPLRSHPGDVLAARLAPHPHGLLLRRDRACEVAALRERSRQRVQRTRIGRRLVAQQDRRLL